MATSAPTAAPPQPPAITTTTTTTETTTTTTTTASQSPPSLILTPPQFARLQPHTYLLTHLNPPPHSGRPSQRVNGRAPSQFRAFTANTGSLTHAHGSAVVRVGDATAVCGVRGEILRVEDIAGWNLEDYGRRAGEGAGAEGGSAAPTTTATAATTKTNETELYNLLVPNVSLNTGCLPNVTPGAAPAHQAQGLSHEVLTLLNKSRLVNGEDLRIYRDVIDLTKLAPEDRERDRDNDNDGDNDNDNDVKMEPESTTTTTNKETVAFWTLYIDVLVISASGPILDIAWPAIVAALRNTRLPRAYWDDEREGIVCSDSLAEGLWLETVLNGASPAACTFAVFNGTPPEQRDQALLRTPLQNDDDEARDEKFWMLADPDAFEESLCQEKVTVVLDRHGAESATRKGGKSGVRIIKIEKNGGLCVGKKEVGLAVALTAQRWQEMKKVLDAECTT